MKEQILSIVKSYMEAIHTQDEKLFKSLWADNSNVTLISITRCFYGTDAIYQEFLIDLIQKTYESIHLIADDIQIKKINNDLAIVVFQYHTECIKRDTLEPYGIEGLETQVLVKENDEWKIQHIHYSK